MNIKTKVITGAVALTVIPLVVATLVIESFAIDSSKAALEAQVNDRLVAVREMKRNQIEAYFETLRGQILTFSDDVMTADAIKAFKPAFKQFPEEAYPGKTAALQQSLTRYYTEDFATEFKKTKPW